MRGGQKLRSVLVQMNPPMKNLASVIVLLRMHSIINATHYAEISLKSHHEQMWGRIIRILCVDLIYRAISMLFDFLSHSTLAVHYISTGALQIKPIPFQVVSAHEFSAGIEHGMK